MNYSAKDLKPLTRWDGQPTELLVWNDDWPDTPPMKRRVIGMQIASKPWIAEIHLQDGTDTMSYQHAAEIPDDWTPYQEPKEIPFIDCEVGKVYRVVGNCGMDFDRKMMCVVSELETGRVLFGDNMDDKKLIGTAWIDHVYTC